MHLDRPLRAVTYLAVYRPTLQQATPPDATTLKKQLKKRFMAFTTLLFTVAIAVTIYKIVEVSLTRFERLKAMQRLEGQDLIAYLGKAAPQTDSLKQTMWWLMRIGSIVLGIGISFLLIPWIEHLLPTSEYANTGEMFLVGMMMLCGTLLLIIELLIEHRIRR